MRVIVIGANGQLGSDVITEFCEAGDTVTGLTPTQTEISDFESVMETLKPLRPDVIVDSAAMHHLERCEDQPDRCCAVIANGARNLAHAVNEVGALLIHISTDYVFDGSKGGPYVEADSPLPLNIYGNTKLIGESFVRSIATRYQVLRTSALYGKQPCRAKFGLNFPELMLKLAGEGSWVRVVDDEFITPTYSVDLAEQIVIASRSDCTGLFHATAEGSCSWLTFAREIFSLAGATGAGPVRDRFLQG